MNKSVKLPSMVRRIKNKKKLPHAERRDEHATSCDIPIIYKKVDHTMVIWLFLIVSLTFIPRISILAQLVVYPVAWENY